jgi:ligand-binding sensor domain-containing protein/serine phosphatase RsbU (regulator of sigma subunit)
MKSIQIYFLINLLGLVFCYNIVFGQAKFDLENDFNELYQVDFWNADTHDFSNSILSFLQSEDGFIWIGTFDGLYKFDGINFERIDTQKENENSFTNHGFNTILEDSEHNIWFGTNGSGVTVYDAKEKKYKKIVGKEIEEAVVFAFFEDTNGDILVGTNKQLIRIRNQKIEIIPIGNKTDLTIQFFYRDKEGVFWLATRENGLIAFKSNKIIQHYTIKNGLPSNDIYTCFKDSDGIFWVATDKGLFFLKDGIFIQKIIKSTLNTPFLAVRDIYQNDEDKLIWLSTDTGLFCIRGKESFPMLDLLGNSVMFTQKDRDGNIWAGTYRRGLVRFKKNKFLAYSKQSSLTGQAINVLAEDAQKNIWIGSNEGLSLWKNNAFTNFKNTKGLIPGRVRDIFPTKDKVWVAIYGGISYFQNGEFYPFEANDKLKNHQVKAIYYDENTHDLWIGTVQGLYCYTSKKKMLFYGQKELGNIGILSINPSSQGLAISTGGGGVSFYKNGEFKRYTIDQGLAGNVVFTIYEDENNAIWIATNGGLTLMEGDKLTTFKKKEALGSNSIFQIIEDEQRHLWLASSKSIFSIPKQDFFDLKSGKITKLNSTIFTIDDGLPSNVTPVSKSLQTKDNWLMFSCLKGVGLIKPSTTQINKITPKVHIKGVKLDGHLTSFENKKLILSPKNGHINISFLALSYANPKRVMFKYRLYPFEEEWIETSLNEVNYTRLPAGSYTFEIRAANSDGIWSEKDIHITLEQEEYFYNKTSFFIFSLLFLGLISWLVYYRRLLQHKKVQITLEELVLQRTSEIRKLAKEIEKHDEEITQSYQEISGSIDYAKQIQNAILRDDSIFKMKFADFFIFWKAKDIVSGDFYWSAQEENKIIIAVGDCTGHGVGGAFMTILGSSTLDKIVLKDRISDPAVILKKLDEEIYKTLHKSEKYKRVLIHEGMDISICTFDYTTNEFVFTGAKSRALYFQENKISILDGDRFSVGDKRKRPLRIKTQVFSFERGDRLYLFSDGFADQFGGENNSKYMTHRLIDFVSKQQELDMEEQEQALITELEEWQGNQPQIDDIIFVGIEL